MFCAVNVKLKPGEEFIKLDKYNYCK